MIMIHLIKNLFTKGDSASPKQLFEKKVNYIQFVIKYYKIWIEILWKEKIDI